METSDRDAAIIRRVRGGDVEAFSGIVERYHGRCLRYALRMLGNMADAEDVIQDSFVRAFRALPTYDERGTFAPWLFRIVVNRCRSAGAARQRRRDRFVPFQPERFEEPMEGDPAAAALWRRLVGEALKRLPTPQREAFLLKHVEELSYEEMEQVTGASESALKMRVKRARAALQDILKEPLV